MTVRVAIWSPGCRWAVFRLKKPPPGELSHMLNQGVRGARVVQERAPQTLYVLRLPQATVAQRNVLQTLQSALDGKALRACPPAP